MLKFRFGFQMKHSPQAPVELQQQAVNNTVSHSYNLHSVARNCLRGKDISSNYGNRQFQNFYAKLLLHHNQLNAAFNEFTYSNISSFKSILFSNYVLFFKKFLSIFNFLENQIVVNTYQRKKNESSK